MDVFSFIECANQTRSLSALFELLVNCATEEGFSEVAYGALTFSEPVRLPEHAPPAIAVKFPLDWCKRYFERKYFETDPIVRWTPSLQAPFLWDRLAQRCRLSAKEQLVLRESREAGLRHGVSVPLFGPFGRVSVMSFASASDDVDPLGQINHLEVLAGQFHIAFSRIATPPEDSHSMIELSPREIECLQWTAEGKSAWDIGVILGISANTANYHIKIAMKKLGTTRRVVAVLKAIRLNLIALPKRLDI
jgi:LuxR family quorum-sensing system transcriptional regulator CciR